MSDLDNPVSVCQNCHAMEGVERHEPWCEKSPVEVQEAYLNDFIADGGSNSLWMCDPCGGAVYDMKKHLEFCPAGPREWKELSG